MLVRNLGYFGKLMTFFWDETAQETTASYSAFQRKI
jgi:hypothetical protein